MPLKMSVESFRKTVCSCSKFGNKTKQNKQACKFSTIISSVTWVIYKHHEYPLLLLSGWGFFFFFLFLPKNNLHFCTALLWPVGVIVRIWMKQINISILLWNNYFSKTMLLICNYYYLLRLWKQRNCSSV